MTSLFAPQALGSFYFLHESLKNIYQFDFKGKTLLGSPAGLTPPRVPVGGSQPRTRDLTGKPGFLAPLRSGRRACPRPQPCPSPCWAGPVGDTGFPAAQSRGEGSGLVSVSVPNGRKWRTAGECAVFKEKDECCCLRRSEKCPCVWANTVRRVGEETCLPKTQPLSLWLSTCEPSPRPERPSVCPARLGCCAPALLGTVPSCHLCVSPLAPRCS